TDLPLAAGLERLCGLARFRPPGEEKSGTKAEPLGQDIRTYQ
ncbi:hypothetical protein LCGC14_2604300, partial [marine sediment metagenome]